MVINSNWYLIETIITALVILVGILLLKIKYKKGIKFYLFIVVSLFITIFELTLLYETPEMEIANSIKIEIGSKEALQLPKTTYHLENVTDKVSMEGQIDYEKMGKYIVVFSVDTMNGTYSKNVVVNVLDSKSPVLTLQGEDTYNISYKKQYAEPGYAAIDEHEGDLSDKVKVSEEKVDDKNVNIIYEVEDSSGNITKIVRKINIIDDISPEIKLNESRNMVIALNEEYQEKGATAIDEIDGDLTEDIKIIGEVDTSKEGTYYITYKVSDKSGNEATNQRIVIVKKPEDIQINPEELDDIGIIFLTFDDGPSTNITPKVLDILNEKNVKATFFILNYNEEEEQIVKREYQEGHSIGIHGYSHDYSAIYESEEAYMENIRKLQEKIEITTGYTPKITRFPGGSSNTISKFNPGIMTRLSKLVVENGYKYFDWNVSSEDAVGADTPDELYNNVVGGLSKTKRNFVLMHDFTKNEAIIEALPRIIDYGNENGYVFEKITEETPMLTHRISN